MTKRPILFSTPMVQAILEGRKTMTRRVIKPQPDKVIKGDNGECVLIDNGTKSAKRPYCVGDILWVRETWGRDWGKGEFIYRADNKEPFGGYAGCPKWKPSIHMPRRIARIFLEVKAIRIERLQDITGEDAKAEGIERTAHSTDYNPDGSIKAVRDYTDYIGYFKDLWDSLNAKRCYSWDSNPWVWVIEFERILK